MKFLSKAALAAVTVGLSAAMTSAQVVGYEGLSASEFLAIAEPAFSSGDSEAILSLSEHAWGEFLSDADFVARGDLATVLKMVGLFGRQRDSIDEAAVAALKTAVDRRVRGEGEALSGMDLYELTDAAKAFRGIGRSMVENAPLFVEWMKANDWRSLETQHLYNLFGFVNADAVDRRSFSARWTGTITPPRTGEYTFRQARVYRGDDSRMKLWVDGDLVVDSTEGADESYESRPATLTGGKAIPLRLELVHETDGIEYSVSAPMALVTWKGPGIQDSLIPTRVLSPPQGSTPDQQSGLVAEYFGDTGWTDLRSTRVDSTLDKIWSWPPTAPTEIEATREVFGEIVSRLLDDDYMNRIAASSDDVVAIEFDRNLWRIAYRMSGAERMELIEVLRRNPKVLARLSPEAIGRLYRGVYMLPGDTKWELVGEWADATPQPRCQPGWYPGWGSGGFQKLNTDFYWAIGQMMQGPYVSDAEALCDAFLVRSDGECCLVVAYAAAFAGGDDPTAARRLLECIDEELSNEGLNGDQRMTWLVARAFVKESLRGRRQRLIAGIADLREALLVAESQERRFWALQELASRLIALGERDRVDRLIEDRRSSFSDQQNAVADKWLLTADAVAARLAAKQANEQEASKETYLAELQRRRDLMRARGRAEAADRVSSRIEEVRAASDTTR